MDLFIAKIIITDQPGNPSSNRRLFRHIYNSDLLWLVGQTKSQIWFDEETLHTEYLNGYTNVHQSRYVAYIYRQAETTSGIYALAKLFQGYVETSNLIYHWGLELEFPNELPIFAPGCYEPGIDEWPKPQLLE